MKELLIREARRKLRRLLLVNVPGESPRARTIRQIWTLEEGLLLSRQELAERLGVQRSVISNYIHRSGKWPKKPTLVAELRKMGVTACPCGDVECGGGCKP